MLIARLWSFLITAAQTDDGTLPGTAAGAPDASDLPPGETLAGAPDPLMIPVDAPVQIRAPAKTVDPIEALSDTAETATEAASDFLSWLGSGQSEALVATVLVVAITALLRVARWGALKTMERWPSKDDYSISALFRRVVRRFHLYFMFAIALSLTEAVMPLPGSVSGFVRIFFVLTAVLQTAEWVQEFSVSAIRRNLHRSAGDARALASAFNIIKWFIGFAIWSVALLLILDNVGADVTALLAGLGIGGIAIGIAAQGVFRDLFSSLSIVIDKPFQVGDTVRYGDSWGAIEDIGLKSTRVRARSGEQLIISNTNLLNYEIHNMARMVRRRIETDFGVIYQTDPELAEQIPDIVQGLVRKIAGVEFERCGMSAFGASSLDYKLIFFSLHPDYNRSMAALSRVLLALNRGFREHGIEFAYPTQTLYIQGADGAVETQIMRSAPDSA